MNSLITTNNNRKNLMFPEFPSLFDDFITRDFFNLPVSGLLKSSTLPSVNIKETDLAFELEMAVPGMDKKDFKIEVDQDTLIISAQHENKIDENSKDGRYSRKEFSYQSFKREFQLPKNIVNDQEINANYKDGILSVHVPKKEPAHPKLLREIAVV